jgi:hypothetical protein
MVVGGGVVVAVAAVGGGRKGDRGRCEGEESGEPEEEIVVWEEEGGEGVCAWWWWWGGVGEGHCWVVCLFVGGWLAAVSMPILWLWRFSSLLFSSGRSVDKGKGTVGRFRRWAGGVRFGFPLWLYPEGGWLL